MLADIPAPFRSGAVSPAPSGTHMEVPESPCLTDFSPGGYGSISQVLLPDVTPSPAMHHNTQRFDNLSTDMPAMDPAIVTLLRLQLASAENIASERLIELQSLEEQVHNLKAARVREAEELGKQVSYLEEQLRGSMEVRDRTEEERAAYTASLEDELKHAEALRDRAIESALAETRYNARLSHEAALKLEHQRWEVAWAARDAATQWASVRDLAEDELDLVRSNQDVLTVLLAEVDDTRRQMYGASS